MHPISHQQAKAYWLAQADGLLDDDKRAQLDAHLAECPACRAEAQALSTLEHHLRQGLHAHWDFHDGPSVNVAHTLQTRARRIIMTNRIRQSLSTLAAVVAIVLFGVLINAAITLMRHQTASPAALPQTTPSLIAFASAQSGNAEIYGISPDGGDPINLTNHPAQDTSPAWSPDGQWIAFASSRQPQGVYAMRPDGSGLKLLAALPSFDLSVNFGAIRWSPDGARLLFSVSLWDESAVHQRDILYVVDVANSALREISSTPGFIREYAWSRDGAQFFFVVANGEAPNTGKIYAADAQGAQPRDVTKMITAADIILPRWMPDGQNVTFAALHQSLPLLGGSEGEQLTWTIYQASPDGNSLVTEASFQSPVGFWWNGAVLLTGRPGDYAWTWVRADGRRKVWNPYQPCSDVIRGGVGSSYEPSVAGSLLVSVYCQAQNTLWLYRVNAAGTEFRPLNQSALTATEPASFAWSPDDRLAAMTVATPDGYALYLVDVVRATADPTLMPRLLLTSAARIEGVVWRPGR